MNLFLNYSVANLCASIHYEYSAWPLFLFMTASFLVGFFADAVIDNGPSSIIALGLVWMNMSLLPYGSTSDCIAKGRDALFTIVATDAALLIVFFMLRASKKRRE